MKTLQVLLCLCVAVTVSACLGAGGSEEVPTVEGGDPTTTTLGLEDEADEASPHTPVDLVQTLQETADDAPATGARGGTPHRP